LLLCLFSFELFIIAVVLLCWLLAAVDVCFMTGCALCLLC
jgi:hypothetical protein